jgi:hypothetical protein
MHSWRRYHLGHNTRDDMRLMLSRHSLQHISSLKAIRPNYLHFPLIVRL